MADFTNSLMINVTDSRIDSVLYPKSDLFKDDCDENTANRRLIVVGHKCKNNLELQSALKSLELPVVFSDTGLEFIQSKDNFESLFVIDNFASDAFQKLHKAHCKIVGPAVLVSCAHTGEPIPRTARPLYCQIMRNLVLCFTGFKSKDELTRLVNLVHYMGGSIRKDFSSRVSHLVANSNGGEKYRVAVSMGTPIMSEEWIHQCWETRDRQKACATDVALMQYRLQPFAFLVLAFSGFSNDDTRHMEEIAVSTGGSVVQAGSPSCSHLVVNDQSSLSLPNDLDSDVLVVRAEWFWASVRMDACADESMYKVDKTLGTPTEGRRGSPGRDLSGGGSRSRKRKRLRDNLALLASEGEVNYPQTKRQSHEFASNSCSASFLDTTADASAASTGDSQAAGAVNKENAKEGGKTLSARRQTVLELYQTEKNYVSILQTIVKEFKEEIEKTDQPGGAILDPTDVKLIFGKIPPIFEVHMKIRDELREMVNSWNEEHSVGQIFLKRAEELMKFYPPFVNFFQQTKETIGQCEKMKPRFHAFLKMCQHKPECGRQTLTELLIRPVQRLPSITLLLRDLLKRTDKTLPDVTYLEKAIAALEEVMTHINEDKRKTEGHQALFDIVNDIENCPPNLLSSHRTFVAKIDAVSVQSEICNRGDNVTLFVFSDSTEICKRRVRVLSTKSPAPGVSRAVGQQKAYRHLGLLPHSLVKRLLDITDADVCDGIFGLIVKKMSEEEKLEAYALDDEATDKKDALVQLSKTICASVCRPDYDTLIANVSADTLNLDTTNIAGTSTLTKAATKFGKKVQRALSISKTPRKLSHMMSSMSQLVAPGAGGSSRRDSLLPATPKNDARLVSASNISIYGTPGSSRLMNAPSMMSLDVISERRGRLASSPSVQSLDVSRLPDTPSSANRFMSTIGRAFGRRLPPFHQ